MPEALKLDWSAVRALHAAGASVQDLAEKFKVKEATIYKRIERGNWKADRLVSQASITQVKDGKEQQVALMSKGVVEAASFLQNNREKFLSSSSNLAVKGMEQLQTLINQLVESDSTDSVRLQKLSEIASVAGELMKTGKPVFGLNDTAQVNVGVQVGILSEIPEVDVLDQL